MKDLQELLENKAGQSRSIYGSRGCAPTRDKDCHAGYTNKSGQAEYNEARHRGAAHIICFTNEVMDHEFPEGFKPVNIESYDGTTDPAVWIEDFFSPHSHGPRG